MTEFKQNIDLRKIHFTSDTHFCHNNIIEFCNRPFKDVNHMNESIINNWNKVVAIDDEIYMLGDVCLCNEDKKVTEILNRLNGKIYLIKGNHEKSVLNKQYNRDRFEWIKDYYEMTIADPEAYGGRQSIVLCHYGFRVWNKSHHGSYHLYGHSHDTMEREIWGRSMDVGIDSANRILGEYRPFNYIEIRAILSKRSNNPVDHHIGTR